MEQATVVVVGAGLAGLAAAATAARAGARVVILDEKSPGGRARTDVLEGFRFNRGAHAVYLGGVGRRVMRRLGVQPAMHTPPLRGARILDGGEYWPLMSRRVLGPRAAAQLTALSLRLSRTNPADSTALSARDWIAAQDLAPRAEAMVTALVRVSSYVDDHARLSADIAVGQLRLAFRGVGYPDDGWQAMAEDILAAATAAGAEARLNAPVTEVAGEPGAWRVRTMAGEEISAAAVIVAAGAPAAARRLLSASPDRASSDWGWPQEPAEVTAACLDLGVRHTRTRIVFGADEPLYLSPHAPAGHLAPEGSGMVHVMRYGAVDAHADRARLAELAAAAGISKADIAAERFLPRMVVSTYLPPPGTGIAGRPAAEVPGRPGLFVAGDWVGPEGWLSDGSLASGERAGRAAARIVTDSVVYQSVNN